MTVVAPTWEDYVDEEVSVVDSETEKWKHGTTETLILFRESDNTYWQVSFQVDNQGDYHSWRDAGEFGIDIIQVKPVKKVIETTEWVKI